MIDASNLVIKDTAKFKLNQSQFYDSLNICINSGLTPDKEKTHENICILSMFQDPSDIFDVKWKHCITTR